MILMMPCPATATMAATPPGVLLVGRGSQARLATGLLHGWGSLHQQRRWWRPHWDDIGGHHALLRQEVLPRVEVPATPLLQHGSIFFTRMHVGMSSGRILFVYVCAPRDSTLTNLAEQDACIKLPETGGTGRKDLRSGQRTGQVRVWCCWGTRTCWARQRSRLRCLLPGRLPAARGCGLACRNSPWKVIVLLVPDAAVCKPACTPT